MNRPSVATLVPKSAIGPLAPLAAVPIGWWSLAMGLFAMLITLGYWGSYANPWLVIAAACCAGPLMGLTLSRSDRSVWSWLVIAMGWGVLHAVVFWQVTGTLDDPTALWPPAASAMAMGGLAMSGAIRPLWLGQLFSVAVGLHWALFSGVPLAQSLQLAALFGPVFLGICYGVLMRRALAVVDRARQNEARVAERVLDLASRAQAREAYQAELVAATGGILDRIASGAELTAEDRIAARLTEAQLRDAIRGRNLATAEVVAAVRAARARGVLVSLVDDRRTWDCSDAQQAQVLAATIETLEQARGGDACTVRLHPPGRRNLATVLLARAEGEDLRRDFANAEPGVGQSRGTR